MLKRLFSIITISLILTGSFFSGYNLKYPVYADSTTDNWTQVTTNEQLVEAFKYYCKSRDLTIEGSVADAVTSFTTKSFNGLCNTLGIDLTALQSEIKYQTDGNLGNRFLFSSLGIDAYNRIFAQFLQDNNLEVGDEVNDEVLYSGKWFVDADGNGCLVYIINSSGDSSNPANIQAKGTQYRYSGIDLYNSINVGSSSSFTINLINGNTITRNYNKRQTGTSPVNIRLEMNYDNITQYYNDEFIDISDMVIIYINNPNLGNYGKTFLAYYKYKYSGRDSSFFGTLNEIPVGGYNNTPCNIYITTNNNVINNNTYEGDTIINNNGNTGDGGGGTPPDPDPDPDPDPPTIPDSGGWQDFTLPDMPNDWLIYGMEKKFPFDIPFNIMFGLSLLNHEPEIPKFEGDIDLKVCTWHYDIDLTPFDDIATMLRRFEVLAFIIGLAMLTKELIMWG